LPNVRMMGPVRYRDSAALFERAKIFLNTSSIEGFPNTFLQAWIRGVPVVTFFDPDGLVQKLPAGRVTKSLDDMREAIRHLLAVETDRLQLGRRARDFATREFTDGVAARYLELLDLSAPRMRIGAAQETVHGANTP
jgi:glycosyltransferase involved in cell wall biosynthesis